MSRYDHEMFLDYEREEARGARDDERGDDGLYHGASAHAPVPPHCPYRGPAPCPFGECASGCGYAEES